MAAVLAGEGVLVLLYPLLTSIGLMEGYTVLLLLYVLMANLHSLCGAMAQALGKIRLYAAGGILCTALVVLLNILLLAVFRMGITGYILSNIIADGVTALVLFAALRLWRYLNPRALRRSLAGSMFRYCLRSSPPPSAPGSSTSPTGISSATSSAAMSQGSTRSPARSRWPS